VINITHHQGSANQNHSELSSHTCQNDKNQKHKKQQVLARIQSKRNPCSLLVGMQTGAATVKNSMEVPQNIQNRAIL